jgi:hypothetical protein
MNCNPYGVEVRVTSRIDGFQWWYVVKVFPTRQEAEQYKRLYYKNAAQEVRVTPL